MSVKRWLTQVVVSGFGMGVALVIFTYRNDIGHGIAFGIPWHGIGLVCLVILGILAAFAIFAGLMIFTRGWILAVIVIAMIVGAIHAQTMPNKYRGYQSQTVKVTKPTTVEQICSTLRPTWSVKDCADRVREENRVLGKDGQPQVGDRLFLDHSIGHRRNGDDRNDAVDYRQVSTTIGQHGQFKSLATACDKFRPTWKIKYCARKITEENPHLRPGVTLWRVTIPSSL